MSQTAAYGEGAVSFHPPLVTRKASPPTFVREHSVGSLLRSTWTLYRSNFSPLFLCYFLPTFTVAVLEQLGAVYEITGLSAVAVPLNLLLAFLATGAVTVTISDICLGNTPSLRRSYGRLLKQCLWLRLAGTGLLQSALIVLGLLLLVVPGLVLIIRLMFTANLLVIERSRGPSAIKRSLELTRGGVWRLAGITSLLCALTVGAVIVLMCALFPMLLAVSTLAPDPRLVETLAGVLFLASMQGIFYPFFFIAQILLLYDLKVRKEAYDSAMLAEDMMR
jgi:hypothetical protein